MVFEDDSKLLGLLMRYSDLSEIDDLKNEIVKYINTQTQDIQTQMTQYHNDYTADVPLHPDASDPLGDVRNYCFYVFLDCEPGRLNVGDEKAAQDAGCLESSCRTEEEGRHNQETE